MAETSTLALASAAETALRTALRSLNVAHSSLQELAWSIGSPEQLPSTGDLVVQELCGAFTTMDSAMEDILNASSARDRTPTELSQHFEVTMHLRASLACMERRARVLARDVRRAVLTTRGLLDEVAHG
ncbi:MAG TPA: hypothetical protein VFZ09_01290 [Archangium sp.]|uniref:hypothetical protein n=1 Tax=Archangium sp. TaxID=1872627 RepID=UPI002E37DA0D|nr:hypothetical protein [Archangium sp.]HEX5744843.1 hypothetical protein [Archangium sp.]